MLNGAERRAARIGYQVQFAREESLGSMVTSYIFKHYFQRHGDGNE